MAANDTSNRPDSSIEVNQSSGTGTIQRFVGGAAIATFLSIILISYGVPIDWSWTQVGTVAGLALVLGLLSVVWGQRFIDAAVQTLSHLGL
ncbi:hypothetical protein IQ273_18320 [Nodosilinea sp. LEGE 07298]|uniref:hypothetical protein n=1 Tax=Nodosilinea sp. LEGE 07298 TaxID=2777970 RepID=UPI001880F3D3|nr:hypothetical protein [Nodosilinea sp. LEGE 07298]MBE9111364.1 hypothetical protein [Nodosilinea sp. LEGE 07298]